MKRFRQDLGVFRRFRVGIERHGGKSGYEHDLQVRIDFGGAAGQLYPIHFRHDDIGQEQVERLLAQALICAGAIVEIGHFIAGALQGFHQETAHVFIIFGEQNSRHGFPSFRHQTRTAASGAANRNALWWFGGKYQVNVRTYWTCQDHNGSVERATDGLANGQQVPHMNDMGDFTNTPPFHVSMPEDHAAPFVFNSPHSGRCYPDRFLAQSRLDRITIRRSEDAYVDELFSGVVDLGAPLLAANFPRAWLDVNREPWELDPRMFNEPVPSFANTRSARVAGGLGTVPRLVGEGLEIYRSRLPLSEALSRIELAYKPYHNCLQRLLARIHGRFGHAILVDCHSMPANIRVGDEDKRPDFIIGDRFGTSASQALSENAIRLLRAMGYSVTHNKPYAGGFITEHYGRPGRGLHAVQIEVNRGLYMNEGTYEKTAGFSSLRDDISSFCRALMKIPGAGLSNLPLAAE